VAAVPRQEDDGHASAPELALDRVAIRWRGLQPGAKVSHGA